jgi:hypothetical protein
LVPLKRVLPVTGCATAKSARVNESSVAHVTATSVPVLALAVWS